MAETEWSTLKKCISSLFSEETGNWAEKHKEYFVAQKSWILSMIKELQRLSKEKSAENMTLSLQLEDTLISVLQRCLESAEAKERLEVAYRTPKKTNKQRSTNPESTPISTSAPPIKKDHVTELSENERKENKDILTNHLKTVEPQFKKCGGSELMWALDILVETLDFDFLNLSGKDIGTILMTKFSQNSILRNYGMRLFRGESILTLTVSLMHDLSMDARGVASRIKGFLNETKNGYTNDDWIGNRLYMFKVSDTKTMTAIHLLSALHFSEITDCLKMHFTTLFERFGSRWVLKADLAHLHLLIRQNRSHSHRTAEEQRNMHQQKDKDDSKGNNHRHRSNQQHKGKEKEVKVLTV